MKSVYVSYFFNFLQRIHYSTKKWQVCSFFIKSNKKPAELNKYLKEQMPNLSAKVFRTFNASLTLQQELAKMPSNIKGAGNEFLEERVQFFNVSSFPSLLLPFPRLSFGYLPSSLLLLFIYLFIYNTIYLCVVVCVFFFLWKPKSTATKK